MEEKDYSRLKLKNQLCFPLYLCSKELVRKYTPLLNELDLTYTQYIVMMYLWERKESSLKKMASMILLDSGTLTPLLIKLEKKGYINREKSLKDGRDLIIKITKKGEELKDKALPIPKAISECLNLSEKDAKNLYMLCYKALFNLERKEENGNN